MLTPIEQTNFHAAIPFAQAAQAKWKVPASVTLAQWMPESSWGQSTLARAPYFNEFGIKFEHLFSPDSYVAMETPEYIQGRRIIESQDFQTYPNLGASFDDHARLLATAPRYARAMKLVADPYAFATAIGLCGYSTTPDYGGFLRSFIDDYHLTQYDTLPPAQPAAQVAA